MVVCRAMLLAAVMFHIQAEPDNGRNSHRVCHPGVQGGDADDGGGFERGGCEEAAVIRVHATYLPAYQVAAEVATRPAGPVCRAMPLMVVGGLSEEEAQALGMHNYDKGYLETATLFGGVDRAGPQGRVAQFLGLTTGSIQELGFGAEGHDFGRSGSSSCRNEAPREGGAVPGVGRRYRVRSRVELWSLTLRSPGRSGWGN